MYPGYNFPYTESGALNMDWILAAVKSFSEQLSNFVALNTLKYADPFQWNIESQYAQNTLVIDPQDKTAYLSTKSVPQGVKITNTDYWTPVADISGIYQQLVDSITAAQYTAFGLPAIETINTGRLVWIADTLYICTEPVTQGQNITENAFENTNLDTEFKKLVSQYAEMIENTTQELNARISTIIADGQQTEGNTELIDIRTAWDGKQYTTAGDSVRAQAKQAYIYNSMQQNIDINTLVHPGSYSLKKESLTNYTNYIGDITYYYPNMFVICPATYAGDTDVLQILTLIPSRATSTPADVKIFFRYSANGVFTNFTPFENLNVLKNILKSAYVYYPAQQSLDIDTLTRPGTYSLSKDSLSNYLDILGDITYYYPNMFVICPATYAGDTDVLQILTLIPSRYDMDGADIKIFMRYSAAGQFKNFTAIENFDIFKTASIGELPKIAFCGDSFTELPVGSTYVDYLNSMKVCDGVNLGLSGSTPGTWFTAHESDITDGYDIYFVAFGLNSDSGGNGTVDSADTSTFCGGLNTIINKINNTCPTARIIVWCMDAWFDQTKAELAEQIANIKGCEFYNMKGDSKIPIRINGKFENVMPGLDNNIVNIKNTAFQMAADNKHPNSAAQKMLATYLANII